MPGQQKRKLQWTTGMQPVYLVDVTREDREKELYALLHSGIVREKTHLRALLEYLGNKGIEAPDEPLKEYTIGLEALGKPAQYDPRLDPSVRVEVAKLRQKILEYYRTTGSGHPIRMDIPKGTYLPVFSEAPLVSRGPRWHSLPWGWIAALIAVAVLAAWAGSLFIDRSDHPRLEANLEAFWAPHFDGTPTLLVLGAPVFLKMQGSYFRNPRVNLPEAFTEDSKTQRVLDVLKPKEIRPVYTYTGIGEAVALFHVTRVLAAGGAGLRVEQSNTVGLEDIKNSHIIFIGGRKYNPQLPELPVKPKFEAVNRKIINLEPMAGEPAEYLTVSSSPHGEITEEYALISIYPGFSHGTRLLTLESSSTEGTLAAAEFLARPDLVGNLLARGVPIKPERGVYRAFQFVIGAKLSKGVVTSLYLKAHRLLA